MFRLHMEGHVIAALEGRFTYRAAERFFIEMNFDVRLHVRLGWKTFAAKVAVESKRIKISENIHSSSI